MKNEQKKKRVVILGAGFGGVYTFRYLQKMYRKSEEIDLVLVNENNYFLFTPMLHEVATGSIAPENIIEPLRKVLRCKTSGFHLATVESVSAKDKVVKTSRGEIEFDYCVIALGAETNFHGTKGAAEHCFELKSLSDAIDFKNHIVETFEKASLETDHALRAEMLHFVIVGGGPTGVELAAELADLVYETLSEYYEDNLMNQVVITLIHRGDALLNHFPQSLSEKSLELLKKKRIDVRFGLSAKELKSDQVDLDNGEILKTHTVVWTAGVKPTDIKLDFEPKRDRGGRIIVNESMQIEGQENIYVMGDQAAFTNPGEDRPVPGLAQVATRQARGIADNIQHAVEGKKPKPFVYKHKGSLVSLGDWAAAGEIGRVKLFGHITWWLWRTIYLFKLISWQKKFQVMVDWTINLFTPRDISELYHCNNCKGKKC